MQMLDPVYTTDSVNGSLKQLK